LPKLLTAKRPKPKTIDDLYGGGDGGNLLGSYHANDPRVYQWLSNRHSKGSGIIVSRIRGGVYTTDDHEWKVPMGVKHALNLPLTHAQIVNRYPWYVTWRSPTTGKRLKKYFNTLYEAIQFVAERTQYVDKGSTIVNRHGMEIPHSLVGKLPRPWKWCPCCMKARKFYRVRPESSFEFMMRDPDTWEEKIRTVPLLRCKVCGLTNRNHQYQRSNFWLVQRKVKPGVRRIKSLSEVQREKKRSRARRRRRGV
jgi:hypothetical protein